MPVGLSDVDTDELLQALGRESMKSKSFYDGSNRLITRYETLENVVNNGPALRTDYTYVGATTNVDASKETMSQWNSSWDI